MTNYISLEEVKLTTYKRLVDMGYSPEAVIKLVNSFWKITGQYNGQATRVITTEGQEIYL